jgi:hypothetical protein
MVKRITHSGNRVSRMINPVKSDAGGLKYSNWAVRSPKGGGATEFRIFPQVIDGTIIPQYVDLEIAKSDPEEYISDAILITEACVCWGENYMTFLGPDPAELREAGLSSTPARTLYWELHTMKEERPTECSAAIHNLFKYIKGKGTLMQRPRDIMLMQGVLIENGGEKCMDKEGKNPKPWFPVILQVNQKTAMDSLLKGLASAKDTSKPLAPDNNMIGNIMGLDGNCLRITPKTVQVQVGTQTHYFCSEGQPFELTNDQVVANYVPWEELLHFPSIEQSILYIAEAIGAEATYEGLIRTPYKDFIPAEIRRTAELLSAPAAPAGAYPPVPATLQPAAPAPVAAPAPTNTVVAELSPVAAPAPITAPLEVAPAPKPKGLTLDDAITPEPAGLEPFADAGKVPDQDSLMASLQAAQDKLK